MSVELSNDLDPAGEFNFARKAASHFVGGDLGRKFGDHVGEPVLGLSHGKVLNRTFEFTG